MWSWSISFLKAPLAARTCPRHSPTSLSESEFIRFPCVDSIVVSVPFFLGMMTLCTVPLEMEAAAEASASAGSDACCCCCWCWCWLLQMEAAPVSSYDDAARDHARRQAESRAGGSRGATASACVHPGARGPGPVPPRAAATRKATTWLLA